MDFENQQWDLADQDLNNWLDGDKHENQIPLADILKSIYLTFRQKQIERLSHYFERAFENYVEQERINAERVRVPIFAESEIRFRISELSEQETNVRTNEENQQIITGLLSGIQKVYNDLYEYELPKVVKLIIRNSGNVDMAKDVFQDAIIILLEKIYSNKLDLSCSVKTYLYSICKYLWMDQLRQSKKEMQMVKLFDEEYVTNDISISIYNTPDIFENVNSEICRLGDPCQKLLEFYYYKFMSWDEIASTLCYSNAASARNQKYKCLERIRKNIKYSTNFES